MSVKRRSGGNLARLAALISPTGRKRGERARPWAPRTSSPLAKTATAASPLASVEALPTPETRALRRDEDGSLGFYIQTAAESNTLPVIRVLQGTPAATVLRDGDVLLSVCGTPVAGLTSADIEGLLQGLIGKVGGRGAGFRA